MSTSLASSLRRSSFPGRRPAACLALAALSTLLVGCASGGLSPKARRASPAQVAKEFGRDFGADNGLTGGGEPASVAAAEEVVAAGDEPSGELVEFGVYVLALSWTPEFCCQKPAKDECDELEGAFASHHLAIHGLWPNYDDAEAARFGKNYPQYCGDFRACGRNDAPDHCHVDPAHIPADMKDFGPGYVNDGNFLADHEWPKHGSCTGLGPREYFEEAIETLRRNPGDLGTVPFITDNIGKVVNVAELASHFPDNNVVFRCDQGCVLAEVTTCWDNVEGQVGEPIACPQTVIKSTYSNSCATSKCTDVAIPKVGECSLRGNGGNPGGGGTGGTGGKKCNVNGKGPSCTNDASCREEGWLRCAKSSGCCTTVPLPN